MAKMIQANQATVTTIDSGKISHLPAQYSSNSRFTNTCKGIQRTLYSILWGIACIIILYLLYWVMDYAMLQSTPTSMHVRVSTCGFTIIVLDGLFLTYPRDNLHDVGARLCHSLLQVVGFICMAVGFSIIYTQKSGGHFESVHGTTGIACISVLCFLIFSFVLLYTKPMKKLIHPCVTELWHFVLIATCLGLGVTSLFKSYDLEWIAIPIPPFVFHFSFNSLSSKFDYLTQIFAGWLTAIATFYFCRHIVLCIFKE